ncbi:SDR family oxidoreductase [Ferruginibacter paludis]|uniref:SDR family NAD(P)-dependent oxidoreductase n=1 Tax=Ferruginibacter paludis TaxID=1310417 RepID=UPI0025B357D2|nr:SDR family oxidoreductase [Ferruginibacter paludis]MDN3658876.1 SDR family oxidoreductase [Ferruginibacter paludis]
MSLYNPFLLTDKTILVTGASSGIGKAIAIECSKMGANVIITGRDQNRLKETFSLLQGEGNLQLIADFSTTEGINSFVEKLPDLNGVVHAAGIIKRLPLKFINEKALNELMQTNLYAPALLTQQLYKKKKLIDKSSIVFISSIAASFSSIGNIMYMASKGALNSLCKGIAFELSRNGIRVNSVLPGMVQTNLTKVITEQEIQDDIKRYPLGRYGKPEEIAYAAVYLLSDTTQWMTGSLLTIDGGITLR